MRAKIGKVAYSFEISRKVYADVLKLKRLKRQSLHWKKHIMRYKDWQQSVLKDILHESRGIGC